MYRFTNRVLNRVLKLIGADRRVETYSQRRDRNPSDLVVILDGTMSSLEPGEETNTGLIYKLVQGHAARVRRHVYYAPGVQWLKWSDLADVAMGRGINVQIRRAYSWLASHYRPGDRIFFFGYSRGAFAVRSLAGMIDRVGLLRADAATERHVELASRYYQSATVRPAAADFVRRFCHPGVEVEMIGVFDTVKALGVRLPLLWVFTEKSHKFHNSRLGAAVRYGFHALALDETRSVYEPILWETRDDHPGAIEQVWFRGSHPDVGGQLSGFVEARPLSNIPLVWMLEKAEVVGLELPFEWQEQFPTDPAAPSLGTWRAWGKLFWFRAPRVALRDASERLHPSAEGRKPHAILASPKALAIPPA